MSVKGSFNLQVENGWSRLIHREASRGITVGGQKAMFFLPRALTGSRGGAPPSVTTTPYLRDGGSSHITSAFPICSAYGLAGVLTQGPALSSTPLS